MVFWSRLLLAVLVLGCGEAARAASPAAPPSLARFEPSPIEVADRTLFLTPHANLFLRSKLLSQLRPGTRVVSHWHDMGDWRPTAVERVTPSGEQARPLYLWVVPPRKE
jgi:hypothetical protein